MILSLRQWREAWEPIDPRQSTKDGEPLSQYCERMEKHKTELSQKYPGVLWDNGRYEVYIERLLEKGVYVPDDYLFTAVASVYGDTPRLALAKEARGMTLTPDERRAVQSARRCYAFLIPS